MKINLNKGCQLKKVSAYGDHETLAPNGMPLHLILGVARLFPQLTIPENDEWPQPM